MFKDLAFNFEGATDTSTVMIWVTNEEGRFVWFNEEWQSFTGKGQEELLKIGILDFIHPADKEVYQNNHKEKLAAKISYDQKYRLLRHDGKYRWILENAVSALGENNEFLGHVGSCVDINENSELQRKLNILLDSIYDGFWDWNLTTNYEYMSPRFWEMFGYNSNEMRPDPSEWMKIIFQEDLAACQLLLNKHFESRGEIPFVIDLRYYHKDGQTVYVLCRGKVIEWSEQGAPLRMVGTHTDITELKKTQEFLHQNSKLIEMGELSANIAHEINNPLTIMMTKADRIEREALNLSKGLHQDQKFDQSSLLKIKENAQSIKSVCDRIAKIIHGLQHLSHQSQVSEKQIFSLYNNLEEIIAAFSEKSKTLKVDFTSDLECIKDVQFQGNETQLQQVFFNLINNSLHEMESLDIRWIKVKAERSDQFYILHFSDSGLGINPNVESKIFNPFFTTKEAGRGTGLGLSISRKIIEDHKGSLIYHKLNGHTCFSVQLPLKQ